MYKAPQDYLDADAAAGRIMAHARLLMKLSSQFDAVAPAALRHAAHVANYKSGKLVIHADNGAVAAKIRQMHRRLCDELSKKAPECSDIEVKVQPRQKLGRSSTSTIKPISDAAAAMLAQTTATLPPGPLRSALDSLLQRAARQE